MRPGRPFLECVTPAGVRLRGTIGLLLIPLWSAVCAQKPVPISGQETIPVSARETVPVGAHETVAIGAHGTVAIGPDETAPVGADVRPTWVVDGVPDSVWMLVEAAWGTDDKAQKKELLKRAESYARAANEGHSDDAGRRFAVAVVLASRTDIEGGRTQVRTAAEVHRELEAILELDPQHARAHHLLGRLYAGVRRTSRITRWIATHLLGGGELKKATWQAAEEHLSYAEEHAPEVSGHHFQLAALYASTDRLELALQELEHVFPRPVVFPIDRVVWDSALEAKEEWEQKLVRKAEGGSGCRRFGPNRPGRRRVACR